jgi:two-component system, NarL family, sensor kinase
MVLPCRSSYGLDAEVIGRARTIVRARHSDLPSQRLSSRIFPCSQALIACLLLKLLCAGTVMAVEPGPLLRVSPAFTHVERTRRPSSEQWKLSLLLRGQSVAIHSDRSASGGADALVPVKETLLGPLSRWTAQLVVQLPGLISSVILEGLAWLALLRRRVRKRTGRVRGWLRHRAALKQHRDLFENSKVPIFTCDLHGNWTFLNEAGERLTGYPRQEAVRMNFAEVIAPEQRPRLARILQQLQDGEVSPVGEWELITKDGRRLSLEVHGGLLVEGGKPVGVLGIARDVSRRKQVKEARKLLASIVESTDDAVVSTDTEWCIVSWNRGARNLYGYTAEEVRGKPISMLVPTQHWEQLQGIQEQLRHGGKVSHFEGLGLAKDARAFDISVTLSPLKDAAGQFQGSAAIIRDVTASKQTERELQERTAMLNALIKNSPLGIVVTNLEGRVKMCNPAFERLFLYNEAEILGVDLLELIGTQETPAEMAAWDRLFWSGETVHFTSQRRRKNGKLLDVEVFKVPLLEDGNVTASFRLYHDITRRKQAEKVMWQLSGRLLHLQDEERRRIARDLHDTTVQALATIATNLTWLLTRASALDAISRDKLSDSLALAEQCAREIRTLSYLLHPPLLDEVGLAAALRHYVEGFAQRSGLHVALDLPCEWGRLPADAETALFRVVQESLTNIHRHSGSRQAKVRLACAPGQLRLEVEDEGKGIPPEILDDANSTAAGLGMGILGMRERLRQLGGWLEIHSNGHGTTVRAVLPLPKGSHESSSYSDRG